MKDIPGRKKERNLNFLIEWFTYTEVLISFRGKYIN